MPKNLDKKEQMLLAGFITFICLLSGGLVMAEAITTQSFDKQQIQYVQFVKLEDGSSTIVPIPPRKPAAQIILASNDNYSRTEIKPSKNNFSQLFTAKIFSDKQARLYREIFALQSQGDMKTADVKIKQLNNNILMGHVMAERYLHPTAYIASYGELNNWLKKYSDLPQAKQIYQLALLKKPSNASALIEPKLQNKIAGNLGAVARRGELYLVSKVRGEKEEEKVKAFKEEIRKQIRNNQPTMALSILNSDYNVKFLDDVEIDRLKAEISSGYLFVNKLEPALKLADSAINRSGQKVPMAGWVKGLVQWQRANYTSAAKAFEVSATSTYSSGWMVSAAAYWASRAHMRAGNTKQVSKWLDMASTYPRTFYGLIATRALGHNTDFDWSIPELTREHVKIIEQTNFGKRATALIKAEQINLAEAELQNISFRNSPEKSEALMAYANYFKLPALSMQLGNAIKNKKGSLYDAALYPDSSWYPKGGFKVDRALIHAIVRQESRFQSTAQNASGATGLMQLMPLTANYVSGDDIYHQTSGQHQLKDPAVNLEIGQTYVKELLNHPAVGQDLLSLTIAYNAGPGNLSKWKAERANVEDPLLFIETIPFYETRAFVERVLSNYWIYRMRYNQATPSLDAVAEGKWARYAEQDIREQQLAAAN